MKKIEKLKIDELSAKFVPLTDEEIAEIMGGWYCFSYCMNYISAGSGSQFQHYYDNIYGSAQQAGGVNTQNIIGALSSAGIQYNGYNGVPLKDIKPNGRQIVNINNDTHAVIYHGASYGPNGSVIVNYIDPQNGVEGKYTFTKEKAKYMDIIGF